MMGKIDRVKMIKHDKVLIDKFSDGHVRNMRYQNAILELSLGNSQC